jgi:hypothetical protein
MSLQTVRQISSAAKIIISDYKLSKSERRLFEIIDKMLVIGTGFFAHHFNVWRNMNDEKRMAFIRELALQLTFIPFDLEIGPDVGRSLG